MSSSDDGLTITKDKKGNARRPLIALLLLLLFVSFAQGLYTLPLNRIIEKRLCHEYYEDHDPTQVGNDGTVDESLCKISSIQSKLATLQGIMETTWIIGDFVITIPMSFVAERFGMRLVLYINMVPRACLLLWPVLVGYFDKIFPTKAIIASPFLSILGGTCVFESLIYALTASLSDDNTERATHLAWISSISYIVNFLGPAASAAAMQTIIWLPLWIGLLLIILAIFTIKHIPNRIYPVAPASTPESNPLIPASSVGPNRSPSQRVQQTPIHSAILRNIQQMVSFILHSSHTNLRLLLGSFVLTAAAGSNTYLLVQYISLRYGWTIASAGFLLSVKSVFNLGLLTVLVPFLMRLASRTSSFGPVRLNFIAAMTSLVISIIGACCIGFSFAFWQLFDSLVIYAMGSALPVFKYSLLRASCVSGSDSSSHRSAGAQSATQLFSVAMLSKTLGSLLGAPVMATLWVRGIKIGGAAMGLPYFLSGAFYALAMGMVAMMKLEEEITSRIE